MDDATQTSPPAPGGDDRAAKGAGAASASAGSAGPAPSRPARRGPGAWWHERGIRTRISVLAALLVAVPLLVGVFALGTIMQRSLVSVLGQQVGGEAERLASVIAVAGPGPLGGVSVTDPGSVVQLVDENGHVVATSDPGLTTPLARTVGIPPGRATVTGEATAWIPFRTSEQLLVASSGTQIAGSPYTVVIAVPQSPVWRTTDSIAFTFAALIPLLMLVAGMGARAIVGRTLGSVERMRSTVASIGIDGAAGNAGSPAGARVALPEARDEIRELGATMNAMLDRLDASASAQRRFIADAGHELRSPITTIAGAVEIARDDPEEWRELSPLVESETRRLRDLVEDLMTLTRGDAGATVRRSPVALADLARAELDRVAATSPRLVVESSLEEVAISGDPDALTTVLRNVLDNASRHASGRVRARLASEHGVAVITIDDDGHGIPPEDRGRVFDRFVRLDESRARDSGGSGLGLSIARDLVTRHGGTIAAEAAPDLGGARIRLRLPLAGG